MFHYSSDLCFVFVLVLGPNYQFLFFFFFQAEDGIRDIGVTGVQTCALPICDSEVLPGKDGSASQIFGNWYKGKVAGEEMEGWLCPALGLYFKTAPARIFVKIEPLPSGIDPLWHIDQDAPAAVRFVSAPSAKG